MGENSAMKKIKQGHDIEGDLGGWVGRRRRLQLDSDLKGLSKDSQAG